ncbi:MAG: hypothetical protein ABL893_05905 [Hyphomicrobium sp.]
MIAAVAHALASIDPSIIDGSMLHVAPSAAERFHVVIDAITSASQQADMPPFSFVAMPTQDRLAVPHPSEAPPAVDWPRLIAHGIGGVAAALIIFAINRRLDRVVAAHTRSTLWWAEHRERLEWVRSMIMSGHPHRALYELEDALEDL